MLLRELKHPNIVKLEAVHVSRKVALSIELPVLGRAIASFTHHVLPLEPQHFISLLMAWCAFDDVTGVVSFNSFFFNEHLCRRSLPWATCTALCWSLPCRSPVLASPLGMQTQIYTRWSSFTERRSVLGILMQGFISIPLSRSWTLASSVFHLKTPQGSQGYALLV